MKGDPIPDTDHMSRHCKHSTVSERGEPTGGSFMLRPGETYLSGNWLEALGLGDRDLELDKVRQLFAKKGKGGKPFVFGSNACFAVLQVGHLRQEVRTKSPDNRELQVLHQPSFDGSDPTHCGIFGVFEADELIGELLASTVSEVVKAKV